MLILALAAAAAAAVTPAPASSSVDPDQKIRCQREEVTGSLVPAKKVCHTVAEWRKMAETAQSSGDRMLEQGRICPGCQGR
jgi:hypothetical protein